jgi:hypothetical protein
MLREMAPKGLLVLALLAAVVLTVNNGLWSPSNAQPTVAGIQRELASAAATKLVTAGYAYQVTASCAPPPGYTLRPPLHLVCQVVAHDVLRPAKSPVWFEDVTCGLPVPSGTPSCGSSGGDALQ